MKIIRYQDSSGRVRHGIINREGHQREIQGDIYGRFEVTDAPADVRRLLAPVSPLQILCVGLNYRRHAEESKLPLPQHPVVFFKNVASAQNPGDAIELPRDARGHAVDYECELAVVIGKPCKNVSRVHALSHVLGYTCANDVSARDWQIKLGGGQWCRGKSFDTFAPLGPCLVTTDEIENPNALAIRTELNGEAVQDWHTSDMIFDVASLIEFLSQSTTLLPGTVILTGTPHGVGMAAKPEPRWLRPGDNVVIEIEKIGRLRNPVVAEK